jgi:23S rRNA G2445 N2-methylase RlmL
MAGPPELAFPWLRHHAGSIEAARENAVTAGVADRVTFEIGTAHDYAERGLT